MTVRFEPSGPGAIGARGFSVDALQRTATLTQLPPLLAELGVSQSDVDRAYPLPPEAWTDPAFLLPYAQICNVLDVAARLARCPHLGLLLGMRVDVRMLGIAGSWVSSAPTLRDAINGFIALQSSNTRAAANYLVETGGECFFGYGIYDRVAIGREQVYALATAVCVRAVGHLTGGRFGPLEVHFPFRPPKNTAPFERAFHVPVRFNAAGCGLVLTKAALDCATGSHGAGNFEEWVRLAHANTPPVGREWTARTRHILRPLLARERRVAPIVARLAGVAPRTLNRRLQAEGSSLRALVEEMRLTMAEEYLLLTDLSIGEIALLLGFEAEGSFYRSFRRWTGTTPEAWRASAS